MSYLSCYTSSGYLYTYEITNNTITAGTITDTSYSFRSTITKIVIPDDVTTVDNNPFYSCTNLQAIVIGSGLTSITNGLCYNCSNLTEVTIKGTIKSIEQWAFFYCKSLKTFTIPSTVTSIGYGAFQSCTGLTSINIPDTVTTIGEYAFDYCSGLTSIIFGSSVQTISKYAVDNCDGLANKTITMPDSLTTLGYQALPSSAKYIATSSSVADLLKNNGYTIVDPYITITYTNGTSSIVKTDSDTFDLSMTGRTDSKEIESTIKEIDISNSFIKTIGSKALRNCIALEKFTGLTQVTHIYGYAFLGCTKLRTIDELSLISKLYTSSFKDCTSLTSLRLTRNLKEVSSNVFLNDSNLTVYVPNRATKNLCLDKGVSDGRIIITNIYTVTFVDNDIHKTTVTRNVYEGDDATSPWDAGNRILTWSGSLENITSNKTLTAIWKCQVTFHDDSGTFNDDARVIPYNSTAITPSWARTEYRLSWDKSLENIVENTTINAVWTIKVLYTVVFHDLGGVYEDQTQQVYSGNNATAPSWALMHYTLSWSDTFTNIQSNKTINAIWTEYSKYTVVFHDSNGVYSDQSQTIYSGENATPPEWTRDGYKLSWSDSYTNITSSRTINSVWTAETFYTVTFKNLDGEYDDVQVKVEKGGTVQQPNWYKYGYVTTWEGGNLQNVTSNLTINGWFDAVPYFGQVKEHTYIRLTSGQEYTINADETGTLTFGAIYSAIATPYNIEYIVFGKDVLNIESDLLNTYTHDQLSGIKLECVVFHNLIKRIGPRAFYGCQKLWWISIPDYTISIGEDAFYNTSYYNDKNNWFSNVLYIGNHCIKADSSVKRIKVKDRTMTVAAAAFAGISNIESIEFPRSLHLIGQDLMRGSSIVGGISLVIPEFVETIGSNAFHGNITSVKFNGNKTVIHKNAFSDTLLYKNSNELVVDGYVLKVDKTQTGSKVFSKLKAIADGEMNNAKYSSIDFSAGIDVIGYRAFDGCSNLTSVTLPDQYPIICKDAFINTPIMDDKTNKANWTCDEYIATGSNWAPDYLILNNVLVAVNREDGYVPGDIPGVKAIANSAFESYDNIVGQIYDPSEELEYIGAYAFYNCKNLKSIDGIFDHVKIVERGAFLNCTNFEITPKMFNNRTLSWIGKDAFTNTKNYTGTIESDEQYFDENCYYLYKIPDSSNIPGNIDEMNILAYASSQNAKLTSYTGMTNLIGKYAFNENSKLTGFIIDMDSEPIVEFGAFNDCISLNKLLLGTGEDEQGSSKTNIISSEKIKKYAFRNTRSLVEVEFRPSVRNIEYGAFRGSGLTSIILTAFDGTESTALSADEPFDSEKIKYIRFSNQTSLDLFKKDSYWSSLSSVMTLKSLLNTQWYKGSDGCWYLRAPIESVQPDMAEETIAEAERIGADTTYFYEMPFTWKDLPIFKNENATLGTETGMIEFYRDRWNDRWYVEYDFHNWPYSTIYGVPVRVDDGNTVEAIDTSDFDSVESIVNEFKGYVNSYDYTNNYTCTVDSYSIAYSYNIIEEGSTQQCAFNDNTFEENFKITGENISTTEYSESSDGTYLYGKDSSGNILITVEILLNDAKTKPLGKIKVGENEYTCSATTTNYMAIEYMMYFTDHEPTSVQPTYEEVMESYSFIKDMDFSYSSDSWGNLQASFKPNYIDGKAQTTDKFTLDDNTDTVYSYLDTSGKTLQEAASLLTASNVYFMMVCNEPENFSEAYEYKCWYQSEADLNTGSDITPYHDCYKKNGFLIETVDIAAIGTMNFSGDSLTVTMNYDPLYGEASTKEYTYDSSTGTWDIVD